MNELRAWMYNASQIRTVNVDGEPWFVGVDVAMALGYSNTRKALGDHVDDEDRMDGVTIRDPIGRNQVPVLINESGLYSLILSSKLPDAKKFKRWITSVVLPGIRREGRYAVEDESCWELEVAEPPRRVPASMLMSSIKIEAETVTALSHIINETDHQTAIQKLYREELKKAIQRLYKKIKQIDMI